MNPLECLSYGVGSGLGLQHIRNLAGSALRSLSVILTVIDIHPAPVEMPGHCVVAMTFNNTFSRKSDILFSQL